MHNSEIKNLEFEIQFAETNLRYIQYLAGDEIPDIERINKGKKIIIELKKKLANIYSDETSDEVKRLRNLGWQKKDFENKVNSLLTYE